MKRLLASTTLLAALALPAAAQDQDSYQADPNATPEIGRAHV